jgi:hypothetical protein
LVQYRSGLEGAAWRWLHLFGGDPTKGQATVVVGPSER